MTALLIICALLAVPSAIVVLLRWPEPLTLLLLIILTWMWWMAW